MCFIYQHCCLRKALFLTLRYLLINFNWCLLSKLAPWRNIYPENLQWFGKVTCQWSVRTLLMLVRLFTIKSKPTKKNTCGQRKHKTETNLNKMTSQYSWVLTSNYHLAWKNYLGVFCLVLHCLQSFLLKTYLKSDYHLPKKFALFASLKAL